MIPVVALTGGPCGGKSSALSYLLQKLLERGFYPLFPSESPTQLMTGNLSPLTGAFSNRTFQRAVIKTMKDQLETFQQAARECTHPKPIIIPDRLFADAEVYCDSLEIYESILREIGISGKVEARDGFCDGVFHLRTAALGAEAFYTTANNAARRETLEEARIMCERTLDAWVGHPHLRVIDNSTDFAGKLKRLDQEICSLLGVPVPIEIEKKYLCAPVDITKLPVKVQKININQSYLYSADPSVVLRVRKRGQYESSLYFRTEKRYLGPGKNVETEHRISATDYETGVHFQLPGTRLIKKDRHCFIYENQYFEFDVIPIGDKVIYLLEIELTEETQVPQLPPFISVLEDVTDDERYTNRAMADLSWKA